MKFQGRVIALPASPPAESPALRGRVEWYGSDLCPGNLSELCQHTCPLRRVDMIGVAPVYAPPPDLRQRTPRARSLATRSGLPTRLRSSLTRPSRFSSSSRNSESASAFAAGIG